MWKKIVLLLPVLIFTVSCATINHSAGGQAEKERTQAGAVAMYKQLNFSGYLWTIKETKTPVGPGPNYFSNAQDDVWVDASGKLHLTIRKKDNKWRCTEVYNTKSLGYGKYTFYVSANFSRLDINAILGLFTWDNAKDYNHREIDIEVSRWGLISNKNTQFVVQPFTETSNMYRFDHMTDTNKAAYTFEWQKGEVYFAAYEGHKIDEAHKVKDWLFRGPNVPPPGNEKCDLNFWLLDGKAPNDGVNVEVTIDKFEYTPL
ncbi:MAG: hypothetical protein WCJ46_02615 [bacterium]